MPVALTPRRLLLPAAGLVAALGLAACGGGSGSSSSSNPAAAPSTQASPSASASAGSGGGSRDTLSASPSGALAFNTTTLTAKAGSVSLVMSNPGSSGIAHGIAISGNGVDQSGDVVDPGSTSTVTAQLKPGTYTFFCPVPGHEQAGMKGTLVVH
jgi:uncharacterized cupredoxin-like copper-binding protein